MDLISCYSHYSVQISESSSCSSYTTASSCTLSPDLTPSTQTAVCYLYKTTLSTARHHFITVTWYRNATTQGLQINSGDDPSTAFRLNTHSRLFRKKKGTKTFEINGSKFEVFYDLSSAHYGAGAEPLDGYYLLIMVDSELGLLIGDMTEETAVKKVKTNTQVAKFCLLSRKEHFSGNTIYATKAQFSGTGSWHDILIRCTGENEGLKHPVLLVYIDKRVVIRVKRLQWNFRGNQTIFLDGLLVDLMWDVHDWFFNPDTGSGSGSGSGHAVFMFRTRSGLDSRLWLEEKTVKGDDPISGFSLLVYASKT